MWLVFAAAALFLFASSSRMTSVQLSKNFSLSEFTKSATADRLGIDNTPNAEQTAALQALTSAVLQPLRDAVGVPVQITSGLRVLALNRAVGSKDNSQHVTGQAADFKVQGMTANQVADLVEELGLPVDQLIVYAPSRGGHVHASHRAGGSNRGQRLYAPEGGGYRNA